MEIASRALRSSRSDTHVAQFHVVFTKTGHLH